MTLTREPIEGPVAAAIAAVGRTARLTGAALVGLPRRSLTGMFARQKTMR